VENHGGQKERVSREEKDTGVHLPQKDAVGTITERPKGVFKGFAAPKDKRTVKSRTKVPKNLGPAKREEGREEDRRSSTC